MSSENSYKILDKMAARRGSDLIQSRYKLTSGAYVGYSDFNHMTLQPIKQNIKGSDSKGRLRSALPFSV